MHQCWRAVHITHNSESTASFRKTPGRSSDIRLPCRFLQATQNRNISCEEKAEVETAQCLRCGSTRCFGSSQDSKRSTQSLENFYRQLGDPVALQVPAQMCGPRGQSVRIWDAFIKVESRVEQASVGKSRVSHCATHR